MWPDTHSVSPTAGCRHLKPTGIHSGVGGAETSGRPQLHEVVAKLEVFDQARLRRLPSHELAGQRARRRNVGGKEPRKEPELLACLVG
jgi:hypothetical protein